MNFQDLAEQHQALGDQYAEHSHRFKGDLSDAYSACAEAHHQLSAKLAEQISDED